ncbi:MAG: copper resistance protein CopD, partial [Thaumarchaeota archaeon]
MAKLTVIGSVVLLASGFAMIVVQAYSINAGILNAISTKFGNTWILRMIECAVLLGISLITYYKVRNSKSLAPRGLVISLFFIGVAILATTSLISHGAATGQMIPLTLDFIHNIAASLWIGGIFYVALIILPNLKQAVNDTANISSISIIIPRFSILVITIL